MNKSSTKSIEIDWDEVDKIYEERISEELPENAITTERICEKYGILTSSANQRIRKLMKTGRFEKYSYVENGRRKRYIILKKITRANNQQKGNR